MAHFLTKLETYQEHDKEYHWVLTEPLIYVSDLVGPIIVPKKFETDKNSIPWWLRWAFPVSGRKSDYAAVIHDWVYTTELFPRDVCDCIYLEIMELSGVSKFRKVKYEAVKYFGWTVWNKHTKASIAEQRSLIDPDEIKQLIALYDLPEDTMARWNLEYFRPELGAL